VVGLRLGAPLELEDIPAPAKQVSYIRHTLRTSSIRHTRRHSTTKINARALKSTDTAASLKPAGSSVGKRRDRVTLQNALHCITTQVHPHCF